MTRELARFYDIHRQGLYSLALTITGSAQFAEDAVHDAFARLCQSNGNRPDNLKAYVFAAVRNAAIDMGRRASTEQRTLDSIFNGYLSPTPPADDPDAIALTAERDRILRQAVESLPRDVREIVLLKVFAGLTFEEIGQVVDEPLKTVASRYRRALGKLEQGLRGQL